MGGIALAKWSGEERPMKTATLIRSAFSLSLLALAGCGQASTQTRPDAPVAVVAMAPPPTDSPAAYRLQVQSAQPAPRFPEEALRDPGQRFSLMERLRTEIVHKTRNVSGERWYGRVRPALRHQLEAGGLSRDDVTFLLWEVDQARAGD
jgi:hypothetical protein